MTSHDLTHVPEGAGIYLVPSLPVWGDGQAFRLGQSGLSFRGFRVIVRHSDNPAKRLFDDFVLNEDIHKLKLTDELEWQVEHQLDALRSAKSAINVSGLNAPISFTKPLIMGVLNVTPDSFSDGGDFIDPDAAIARARQMVAEGADIIDIGGESTRPGAATVWEGDEADRVVPVIKALAGDGIPLSIDTRHSFVMKKALDAGVHIINDVSALTYDPDSLGVVFNSTAPVILMHSHGESKDEHIYDDVLLDVYDYLAERIEACVATGISRDRIIVDPGIGFGKRVIEDNINLLNGLSLFHTLGCPILLGTSRKRFIGAITGVENASDRVMGSVQSAIKGIEQGAQIVRVHDVAATVEAMKMVQAFHDYSLMDQPGLRADRKG